FVAETGSTNADLLALASDGASEGSVLVADHQTAGRGRQQRTWHDEPGNALLVSYLLRPDRAVAPLMPLLAGVAACEALANLAGTGPTDGPAGLKWPNDVLAPALDERKLAGILAESATAVDHRGGADRMVVVVGTGMNLRWGRPPPEEIKARAATVEELFGHRIDRNEVLDRYLRHVEVWLRAVETDGGRVLLDRYRDHCLTLGRSVAFTTATAEYEGTATDISPTGTLLLETAEGSVELHAGDAHHRR
ncbi:MAG: biotin--[acetyl-CoA-carboxylase] ligase, partial [Actinomycetota bacterium]